MALRGTRECFCPASRLARRARASASAAVQAEMLTSEGVSLMRAESLRSRRAHTLQLYLCRRQVPLDDARHVLGGDAGVPDIVGVDEDHRPFVVAAGTGVAQHDVRREPAPLDFSPERLDERCPALWAAASLTGRGAHEDLSEPRHGSILCRAGDKSRWTAAQARSLPAAPSPSAPARAGPSRSPWPSRRQPRRQRGRRARRRRSG